MGKKSFITYLLLYCCGMGTAVFALPFSNSLLDEESNYFASLVQNPSDKLYVNALTSQQWAEIKKHPAIYSLNAEYRPIRQLGIAVNINQYNAGFERRVSWQAGLNTAIKTSSASDFLGSAGIGGSYGFYDFNGMDVITEYPEYQNVIENKGYSTFINAATGFIYSNDISRITFQTKGFYSFSKMYRVNILLQYSTKLSNSIPRLILTGQYAYCPAFKNKINLEFESETKWVGFGIGCGYISETKIIAPSTKFNFYLRSAGLSIGYRSDFMATSSRQQLPGKIIHNIIVSYLLPNTSPILP
jgi:hypothetical protein